MQKDFSCHPDEHIITWMLWLWDNRASSSELEFKEAKQLESLSREGEIDKAIGRGTQVLSMWRWLLSTVKERHIMCHPGKWATMERGIQYMSELAMLEMIYDDSHNAQLPTDPDKVQCTQPIWHKMELRATLCQLLDSNELERQSATNGGWS